MKIYEQRIVPEHIILVLTKRSCDICGKIGMSDWHSSIYNVEEIKIAVTVY